MRRFRRLERVLGGEAWWDGDARERAGVQPGEDAGRVLEWLDQQQVASTTSQSPVPVAVTDNPVQPCNPCHRLPASPASVGHYLHRWPKASLHIWIRSLPSRFRLLLIQQAERPCRTRPTTRQTRP
jgi:hypothetical protein